MPVDRDEFREAIALVREDIRGVQDRLDRLNDRTRKAEEAVAVLKDRSTRGAAVWGVGAAGGFIGFIEAMKYWFNLKP